MLKGFSEKVPELSTPNASGPGSAASTAAEKASNRTAVRHRIIGRDVGMPREGREVSDPVMSAVTRGSHRSRSVSPLFPEIRSFEHGSALCGRGVSRTFALTIPETCNLLARGSISALVSHFSPIGLRSKKGVSCCRDFIPAVV